MPVHNRLLLALAAVFLLAGLLLAVAARGAGPLPGDLAFTDWLEQIGRSGSTLGTLLVGQSDTGWSVLGVVIGFLFIQGQRKAAFFSFACGIATLAISELAIKQIIGRPRPSFAVPGAAEVEYGFPSTMTMTAVVVLGLHCYFASRGKGGEQRSKWNLIALIVLSILLLLLFGFGRVYAGLHWISDILGAYLFGLALLLLLILVWKRLKVES